MVNHLIGVLVQRVCSIHLNERIVPQHFGREKGFLIFIKILAKLSQGGPAFPHGCPAERYII
jgi:hypothetical protein